MTTHQEGPDRPVLTVLIVDDDDDVRDILCGSLRWIGFGVHQASGGEQALAAYREHRDAIDAVLLDVRMPGLDGPQTFQALRRLDDQVPVVFMSGDTGEYREAELLDMGAVALLRKPFGIEDVARTLRQASEQSKSRARNDN